MTAAPVEEAKAAGVASPAAGAVLVVLLAVVVGHGCHAGDHDDLEPMVAPPVEVRP